MTVGKRSNPASRESAFALSYRASATRRSWLASSAASTSRVNIGSSKPAQNSASAIRVSRRPPTAATSPSAISGIAGETAGHGHLRTHVVRADGTGSHHRRHDGERQRAQGSELRHGKPPAAARAARRGRATSHELAQRDIEHRGQEQAEERHAEHPGEHGDARDRAHFRAGAMREHERHGAGDEGDRGHHDRAQTQAAGFERGFDDRPSPGFPARGRTRRSGSRSCTRDPSAPRARPARRCCCRRR